MALLVLDEWFWSDAAGENGPERQRETMEFVQALYVICDRLVIVRGSRFAEKADRFWKHADPRRRQFARFFSGSILYNSLKADSVEPEQLDALPEQLLHDTQPEDRYLVQAQRAQPGSIVVTTDTDLKLALGRHSVPSADRNTFVLQYLQAFRGRNL
jgi:hypothetical protein